MLLRVQANFDVYYFSLLHSFTIDGSDSLFDPDNWTFITNEEPREVIQDNHDASSFIASCRGSRLTYAVIPPRIDRHVVVCMLMLGLLVNVGRRYCVRSTHIKHAFPVGQYASMSLRRPTNAFCTQSMRRKNQQEQRQKPIWDDMAKLVNEMKPSLNAILCQPRRWLCSVSS
jgi:hypothetical protein